MAEVDLFDLAEALMSGEDSWWRHYVAPDGRVVKCDPAFVSFAEGLDGGVLEADGAEDRIDEMLGGREFKGDCDAEFAIALHDGGLSEVEGLSSFEIDEIKEDYIDLTFADADAALLLQIIVTHDDSAGTVFDEAIEALGKGSDFADFLDEAVWEKARDWCEANGFECE